MVELDIPKIDASDPGKAALVAAAAAILYARCSGYNEWAIDEFFKRLEQ